MYDKYTMKLQYFHFCIVIIANCIADGNTDAYKVATAISLALAIVTLLVLGLVKSSFTFGTSTRIVEPVRETVLHSVNYSIMSPLVTVLITVLWAILVSIKVLQIGFQTVFNFVKFV